MPCIALGSIQKVMRTAANSILMLEKVNSFFSGMHLLIVQIHAELAFLKASSPTKRMIDFFLGHRKNGGFFVLRLFNTILLFFNGWKYG